MICVNNDDVSRKRRNYLGLTSPGGGGGRAVAAAEVHGAGVRSKQPRRVPPPVGKRVVVG